MFMRIVTLGKFETGKLPEGEGSMSSVIQRAQNIFGRLARHGHGNVQAKIDRTEGQVASQSSLPGEREVARGTMFCKFYLEKLANLDSQAEYLRANSPAIQSDSVVAARYQEAKLTVLTGFRQKNEFGQGCSRKGYS